jgi:hypothetical protein
VLARLIQIDWKIGFVVIHIILIAGIVLIFAMAVSVRCCDIPRE